MRALLPLVVVALTACQQTPTPPAPSSAAATPSASAVATAPSATAASAASPELALGQIAPDFTATDQDGKPVHLADLKGHSVVVYFYPRDETGGCTHEACSFRDAWTDLKKKGVIIIGISTDTADSHKSFAKNHQLPFLLVSDPKGEIAAKYGVPLITRDRETYLSRQSFLVAPDGTLKKIYRKVDVTVHAQEIANDIAS
jgi:thioredoxin-dependent peroxiredoxin